MKNYDLNAICGEHVSRYSLARIVSKRAKEIVDDPELSERCGDEKPVTYALEEFESGKLKIVEPDEIKDI